MSEKIKFAERKAIRLAILKELYDYWFESNGSSKQVNKMELKKEVESHLSYQYLSDHGLIVIKPFGGAIVEVFITARGIDYIENSPLIE